MAVHVFVSHTSWERPAPLQQELRWLPPAPLQELVTHQKPWSSASSGFTLHYEWLYKEQENIFSPSKPFAFSKAVINCQVEKNVKHKGIVFELFLLWVFKLQLAVKSHHLLLKATYCFVVWIVPNTPLSAYKLLLKNFSRLSMRRLCWLKRPQLKKKQTKHHKKPLLLCNRESFIWMW